MSAILILKSLNERRLTHQLIDSWLHENEMFITNKIYSPDQSTVEITFLDEEHADMISDLLNTCYSNYVSISRPQTLNDSFEEEEEREPSPIHLSSTASTSSKVTCFSQRLVELENNKTENTNKFAIGRGRGIEIKDIQENFIGNYRRTSPTINQINLPTTIGRGRGSIFK